MSEPTKILTIEDDAAIRRGIVDALRFAGYQVQESGRGDEGLARALAGHFDLLLLDLVLPAGDGREILRQVRAHRPTLPIIVLTARGEEADRVGGLRDGADDYVVKPFSIRELLARIEAVLRRSPQRPQDLSSARFQGGVVDFERREIRSGAGCIQSLSERECELLLYLARHHGRSISRDELLTNVWHLSPKGISTRTIDMHVARLREKLGDDRTSPEILLTVHGKGYMFQLENDSNSPDSSEVPS